MSRKIILVLNCGSSSLKFAVVNTETEKKCISGIAECFHLPESRITWKIGKKKKTVSLKPNSSHKEAINFIVKNILEKHANLLNNLSAIAHRIVHGGEKFTESIIINESVIKGIESSIAFAPLHNPAHLIGIRESFKAFPKLVKRNVAVFDTAFHQTMPEESYLYALPYYMYKKYSIRRYGAHGTSHYYISKKTAELLNKPISKLNIISCHLGNGSSITAIRNGKCVDTSMGLTPLEGLVMGTRSGDIDPAIIFYLHNVIKMKIKDINDILVRQSGLLGLSEKTSDYRYIEENYEKEESLYRAIKVYCHRLSKYIGSYIVLMHNRIDAIVFTGGIGENSYLIRELSTKGLKLLNFYIDYERNFSIRFGKSGVITKLNSKPIFVIPTNEELVIAQDAANLTEKTTL